MPNDAVYVRVCPCVRVCVYVWMRAKVNFKQSSHSLTKSTQVRLILEQMFLLFIFIFIIYV